MRPIWHTRSRLSIGAENWVVAKAAVIYLVVKLHQQQILFTSAAAPLQNTDSGYRYPSFRMVEYFFSQKGLSAQMVKDFLW